MSFFERAEFLNRTSFMNYPLDRVCSLVKLEKPNFPGRNIYAIGNVIRFCEKLVYTIKKVWADIQSFKDYKVCRKELKQDLCTKIVFNLNYANKSQINQQSQQPDLVEKEDNKAQFTSNMLSLTLLCNARKEIEAIERRFDFLLKSKKAELREVYPKVKFSNQSQIQEKVDFFYRSIPKSTDEDLNFYSEYMERSFVFKSFNIFEEEKVKLAFRERHQGHQGHTHQANMS